MGSVFGRAAVAAGAMLVVVAGSAAGTAVAMPRPAVLAFRPAPYAYGQVAVGQQKARTFTLAKTGGRASSALTARVSGAAPRPPWSPAEPVGRGGGRPVASSSPAVKVAESSA